MSMPLALLRASRHVVRLALVGGWLAAVACSNSSSQPPDVFIAATVGPGPQSPANLCNFGSDAPWLEVGNATAMKPVTVTDGHTSGGGLVHVTCTVHPVADGFDVNLLVEQEGEMGGSVSIISTPNAGAVTASGGSVAGIFESAINGDFQESSCTITYQYQGGPVPDMPPIAAGRIWGHVSCGTAQNGGSTVMLPDGGTGPRQCDGEADFLFEQCSE